MARFAVCSLALASLLACATAAPPPPAPTPAAAPAAPALPNAPTEAAPSLRLPTDTHPKAYRLSLEAHPASADYSGTVEIDVALDHPRQTIWLHAGPAIAATDAQVRTAAGNHAARLLDPDPNGLRALVVDAPVSGNATLIIAFHSPFNLQNEGLYKVTFDGQPYLFTQFESVYARKAFPCFDEPGFKAPMTLTLSVGAQDIVASNTPIATDDHVGERRVVRFGQTVPLPTYLYAWTVGPLEIVEAPTIPPSEIRSQPVPLRGIAPRGKGAQLKYALSEAPRLLAALEKYFGIAYPFEKLDLVAVPDFASGAMENAGLITFRSQLLLLDEKTASVNRKKAVVSVTAHEMAHQWFGDLVTTAWWNDIWLNEAFASWLEIPISDQVHPEWRFPLEQVASANSVMGQDTLASVRAIREPIRTQADVQSAFDGITYTKGAAVIDMFEHAVSTETFRQAIHAYLLSHRFGNATVEDLLSSLDAAANRDVGSAFRTFLDQPGVPLVHVGELDCGKDGNRVSLEQSRFVTVGSQAPVNQVWKVPVCARYDHDGKPDVACTQLDARNGTLALPGRSCPRWIQPNADSRGYYRWTLPSEELAALGKVAPKLVEKDRLSVVNTLKAGYTAGATPAADALRALELSVNDREPEVALAYSAVAADLLSHTDDAALRTAIQAKLAHFYRPQLQKLGYHFPSGEDDATAQKRIELVELLAFTAEEPRTVAELAKLGRAYLGVDGDHKVHPEAVAPEIASDAAAAAVRQDPSLLAGLIDRAQQETDETARRNLRTAITAAQDPAGAERVRQLALDPRTRGNEVLWPYFVQGGRWRLREGAAQALQQNFDAVFARLGEKVKGSIVFASSGFCDEGHAQQVESFFGPRLAKVPAGARNVREAAEGIRLCAARRAVQEPSARSYFLPRSATH